MNNIKNKVRTGFHGVEQQFEELTKNTLEVEENLKNDVKYLRVKVSELDQEVFMKRIKQ